MAVVGPVGLAERVVKVEVAVAVADLDLVLFDARDEVPQLDEGALLVVRADNAEDGRMATVG